MLGACQSTSPAATLSKKTGEQLFTSLCASCHGAQGRGDGPVASLLVAPPPDLTLISQRHNGFFPAVDVQRVIDGREVRVAHGTRSMPVWGRQLFFSADPNDEKARAQADEEIRLLSEYVRSIQQ
jgi:mono/diheme cytochrome c family protein